MFRKIALALGATAVIGVAALTPTTASAWHHHHHGHWRGGYALGVGIVAPAAVLAADCYVVKKVVNTPLGPQIRRITVCG